jgi:hypothetical protein
LLFYKQNKTTRICGDCRDCGNADTVRCKRYEKEKTDS